MSETINGILIDYGGTLDTNGIHWAAVIYDGYKKAGLSVAEADFRKAYIYAEQQLEQQAEQMKPEYTFRDIMYAKMQYQLAYLAANKILLPADSRQAVPIAGYCYRFAQETTAALRPALHFLSQRKPVVLVSNFYGNLRSVLADFGLDTYFSGVVESARVGVRKPDPQIFTLAIRQLGLAPAEVAVIGDSYKNDIQPANRLGCVSVWLKNVGWDNDDAAANRPASYIINNLEQVKDLEIFKQ